MAIACNNSFKVGVVLGSEYGDPYGSDEKLAAVTQFCDYPEPLLRFASACCMLFVLIGIPGNLITIIALARCKKIRNATAIFIINLHISDFIFCCMILPMTAMTFSQKHWMHGLIMCRVYPLFKYSLNATSIFTILAITINRYVIICHPLMYPRLYKRRNISIMLLAIWISSFAIFTPSALEAWGRFGLEPNGGFCTMLEDKHKRSPKLYYLIVAFVGPYLTIAFCYARIWWVVRKTAQKPPSLNVRPTQLPVSHTQADASNDVNRLINYEPSISGNSVTENDSNSAATTPNEGKTLEKFFKAPFRLTKKVMRSKTPTRKDRKLRAMIAAIMISFCVSHLPIMTTKIVYKGYKSEPMANVFAHLLEYSGSCMNPIIYVLMSNEYRHAYKSLFDSVLKTFRAGCIQK